MKELYSRIFALPLPYWSPVSPSCILLSTFGSRLSESSASP